MGRKRNPDKAPLPQRWDFRSGAFYYRTRPEERALFDGKTWFRLGTTYPEALRAFADRREIGMSDKLLSVIDRYTLEVLPLLRPNTRGGYQAALGRLRATMGHNLVRVITPQIVYRYMDAIARRHTMNIANMDLKVLHALLDNAVRWGVISTNHLKGNVHYYGARQGLKKARDRYVEDWELAEWSKVATPVQRAFAALVMLTGARKSDILRLRRSDAQDDVLTIQVSKTGQEQRFEITQALQDAIDLALSTQRVPGFFLLTNADGGCYVGADDRSASFDRAWRQSMTRAIELTQLEHSFTRHDLRAKVGSDADQLARAQELLGHSSPDTTRKHYRRKRRSIRPTH